MRATAARRNHYRLAAPRAALTLKKSAFHLMTDLTFPTVRYLIQRNLLNKYSSLDYFRPNSKKLAPVSPALCAPAPFCPFAERNRNHERHAAARSC